MTINEDALNACGWTYLRVWADTLPGQMTPEHLGAIKDLLRPTILEYLKHDNRRKHAERDPA